MRKQRKPTDEEELMTQVFSTNTNYALKFVTGKKPKIQFCEWDEKKEDYLPRETIFLEIVNDIRALEDVTHEMKIDFIQYQNLGKDWGKKHGGKNGK